MALQSPAIVIRLDGVIGRLTLTNPDKHNALNQTAWQAIPDALNQLMDQGARVIIIEGAGKSFCAGADISEFDVVRKNSDTALIYERANADAFHAIRTAAVPTLAKITGFCLGGGFGLASACDIRLASDDAVFGVPAARLGLAYPVEAMADIVAAIGSQNAKRLLFTAERYSADQIATMGFLASVEKIDALSNQTEEMAQKIATLAPLTHRATKAAIDAALGGDLAKAEKLGNATFTSSDYAEGRAAFREKRIPQFIGK